ncbi:MAG: hypothetical protein IKS93_05805 [Methanobrevibacter sp.]|nr:hypothetical protein [Methanobrevibacter sp.]
MGNTLVKLYRVTFNQYTNCMRDTVAKHTKVEGKDGTEYLTIPKGDLIVREDELNEYKEYGDGFESIRIVGEMYI